MGELQRVQYRVFTQDWVADQRRRYERRPDHARPRLYPLWTADHCQTIRDQIERWVAPLEPEQQRQVIPRLRDSKQYRQTYNELAVGDSLRCEGRQLEYEPDLDGLTPDWLVSCPDTDVRFLVEVVSSNPPEERDRCENAWEEFRLRLEKVPVSASLYMQTPLPDGDEEELVTAPDVPRQKEIVRGVGKWLQTSPSEGEGKAFDGIVIRYLGPLSSGVGVSCGGGGMPYWVDGEPLRDAVKDKAKKYRDVVETRRLPLVVCVVPALETGRGIDELRDAVLGTPRCRLVGPSYRQDWYRDEDGLFRQYGSLSAVTLVELTTERLTHTVLRNPKAIHPLPESAVPRASFLT